MTKWHFGWAGLFVMLTCSAQQVTAPSVSQSSPPSKITYASVAETLNALRALPDVKFTQLDDGWRNASDSSSNVLWSFAPPSDPAYPAVVKRIVSECGASARRVAMDVLCESTTAACSKLITRMKIRNADFSKGLDHFYKQNPDADPCNAHSGEHATSR
jgi:hypothetical protein